MPASGRSAQGSRVAIIGAGWAGLAAAVEATRLGHRVSLHEMAGQAGGRARTVRLQDEANANTGTCTDNGQHILIGAYTETLGLMRQLGVDTNRAFHRQPLSLVDAQGRGLRLGGGPPRWAFLSALWRHPLWTWRERWALTRSALLWSATGFTCTQGMSVDQLCSALPERLRQDFIAPLCVAALNTPMQEASGQVFLRVLRDALTSGPGAADLLLPRERLGALLPEPAQAWLQARGVQLRLHDRVREVSRTATGWLVAGGDPAPSDVDQVVLACTAQEAARLAAPWNPAWARSAMALRYEPITTVSLLCEGARLPEPMLTLDSDNDSRPAQFVFDQGALGGRAGELTFVISGAQPWVDRGVAATNAATLAQAQAVLGDILESAPVHLRTYTEKRATFRCTPGLERPAAQVAGGLWAAADYVDGPYPATLEGAVRSGLAAARSLG